MAIKTTYLQIPQDVLHLIDGISHHGIENYPHSEVYIGRNRIFYVIANEELKINVKEYHKPKFPNNIISGHLRRTKARKALENALCLQAAHIATPQPYGFAELRNTFGLMRLSYFYSQHVEGYTEARQWGMPGDEQRFTNDLATEIRRCINSGILFRDFTPGNVLWRYDDATLHYHFCHVDINRMTIKNAITKRNVAKMIRAINMDTQVTSDLAKAVFRELYSGDEGDFVALTLNYQEALCRKKDKLRKMKRFFHI